MEKKNDLMGVTVSPEVAEKISALGSDMIMSNAHTSGDMQSHVEAMQESIVEKREGDMTYGDAAALVDAAVTAGVDPRMLMRTKRRPLERDYKIRPNDPCPCGSGKKYKKCCMNSGEYEGYHTV